MQVKTGVTNKLALNANTTATCTVTHFLLLLLQLPLQLPLPLPLPLLLPAVAQRWAFPLPASAYGSQSNFAIRTNATHETCKFEA